MSPFPPWPERHADTQAQLNDLAAEVFWGARHLEVGQIELATEALRNLNWATGWEFQYEPPSSTEQRESYAEAAISLTRRL